MKSNQSQSLSALSRIARIAVLALATPVLGPLGIEWTGCAQDCAAKAQEKTEARAGITGSWKITTAPEGEPGEPMIVNGTVYASDGKRPLPGTTVYVYHTDSEGYYRKGNNSSQNPRLKGTMISDGRGRYAYRTIRPAPYPRGGNPAHVHYVLSGKGFSKQYEELLFEGDQFLSAQQRSSLDTSDTFSVVRPIRRDANGVWHVVKDIRLKP